MGGVDRESRKGGGIKSERNLGAAKPRFQLPDAARLRLRQSHGGSRAENRSRQLEFAGPESEIRFRRNGDLSVGQRALDDLEKLPPSETKTDALISGKVGFLMLQKKFEEALHVVESIPDDQLSGKTSLLCGKYLFLGIVSRCMKNEETRAGCAHARERKLRKGS